MDPLETLKRAKAFAKSGDLEGCEDALRAYNEWRDKGGAAPKPIDGVKADALARMIAVEAYNKAFGFMREFLHFRSVYRD